MTRALICLELLRTAGLVAFGKQGRVMYYRLSGWFPHQLLAHRLRLLLTIVVPEEG